MTAHESANEIARIKAMERLTAAILEKNARAPEQEELMQDILRTLKTISENTNSPSWYKKAAKQSAWATLKFPFQVAGGALKTTAITVGVPSLIAIGVYTGNGNDPMDIPCNLAGWSDKNFGAEATLTLTLSEYCSLVSNIRENPNNGHNNEIDKPSLPPANPDAFGEDIPGLGVPG